MVPSKIKDILNLAHAINKKGKTFNVLFSGAAGLGKSEIVQQWCVENDLPFIDLRAAYLEAPDVIGFPSIEIVNGRQVTRHNLPEFWPHSGEGVLFIDEPNRGTTAVLNTFMQLLTDRRIHTYEFPKGWMVVAAINPESAEYDVNTMDAALRNRFEIFDITYDKKTFVNYMMSQNWNQNIITFIEAGLWEYKMPEEVTNGGKYISPRSWSKLNNVLSVGYQKDDELTIFEAVLGKYYSKAFYAFLNNESPVLVSDLKKKRKEALAKLAAFSDPKNYKNALLSITIKDMIDNEDDVTDEILAEVVTTIPADQGPVLIREIENKRSLTAGSLLNKLAKEYPDVKKYFKSTLKK